MPKFRKKPVIIEAIQFTKENHKEINDFVGEELTVGVDEKGNVIRAMIKTLEGNMIASLGDYIIKGISGEFYPCKSDIFKDTYEEVT